jgi:hypothetical protein
MYSSIELTSLPHWDYEQWTTPEPQATNSLKEKLLLGSLELIRGELNNGEACHEIVEQSLESRLFEISFEAIRTFSQRSDFYLCLSIKAIFEEMRYWKHLSGEFIHYCEERVLNSDGGETHGFRSRTLGYLGRYHFFIGNTEAAIHLWEAADAREEVDEVIAEMCEMIAERSPQNLEASLALINLIKVKNIKAKTMATLSKYA